MRQSCSVPPPGDAPPCGGVVGGGGVGGGDHSIADMDVNVVTSADYIY